MLKAHKHYSEAKYCRIEKRWGGGGKAARIASKRYNRADRREVKLKLALEVA